MLKVKFDWKTRTSRSNTKLDNTKVSAGSSRNAKHIQSMKVNNPEQHRQHKAKDAERKRINYMHAEEMSEKKRKQRSKNKGSTDTTKTNIHSYTKKRFKDMNVDEKKQYYKTKMRLTRQKQSKQNISSMKRKDRERKQEGKMPQEDITLATATVKLHCFVVNEEL